MSNDRQDSAQINNFDHQYLLELRLQMVKFATLQLSSLATAEDVVQEALASALQYADSFSGKAALRTWIFAILKNKIIDVIRQKNKLVTITDLFLDQESELSIDELFDSTGHWHKYEAPKVWLTPEESVEQEDFWRIFDICLNELPAKYAQVFMLREMIELTSDEICEKLDISVSNLNVLMYRSRTRLRQCLESKWLLEEDCSC